MSTPHNSANKGDIAKTVLLPGDPLRAKYIADNFLTDVKQFNSTRNMLGFTGYYEGKRVSVMGTGMGCASIGIYSYELINFYGCKNLIRIGTAGALSPDVHIRDVVLAQGACTNSNYVRNFGIPGDYAPICSFSLLRKAVDKAEEMGVRYHVGNVLSSDNFYTQQNTVLGRSFPEMGVLAVEMEAFGLFYIANKLGREATALMTVVDSLYDKRSLSSEDRERSLNDMIELALESII